MEEQWSNEYTDREINSQTDGPRRVKSITEGEHFGGQFTPGMGEVVCQRFWGGTGQAQGLPLPEFGGWKDSAARKGVGGQAQGMPLPEIEGWKDLAARRGVGGQAQGMPLREDEGWDGVGDA